MSAEVDALKEREIARLRADAARTREQLLAVCGMVAQLGAAADVDALCHMLAAQASKLTKACYSAVALFDRAGNVIHFVAYGEDAPLELAGDDKTRSAGPHGLGVIGWLREQKGPVRVAKVEDHPRSVGFPEGHPPINGLVGAPLITNGQTIGVVMVGESRGAPALTDDATYLLGLLAEHATPVVAAMLAREGPPSHQRSADGGPGLHAPREHFSRLFYDSPMAIAITRFSDQVLVDVNAAYQRLTGYSREEVIGRSAEEFGLRADPDRWERALRALRARGSIRGLRLRARDKEGKPLQVRMTAEVMELGGEPHIVAFLEDVTEESKAAEELERLASIVASSDDAIFSYTAGGVVLSWNAGAERIFGYTTAEAVGKRLTDLLQAGMAWDEMERALHDGRGVARTEAVLIRKDGSPVTVALSSSLVPDGGGTAIAVIARDITAQKQAERARDIERERLKTLMETSPAGMLVVDAESMQIVLTNRELERIIGLEGRTGQHLDAFREGLVFRRPDGTEIAAGELPLRRAIERGERVRAEEVVIERADGTLVPTAMSATPIYDLDGRIVTGVLVADDISALKEVERLRSDFLRMAGHELRSPLAIIKTAVDWAQHGDTDAGTVSEALETIDRQVGRLLSMVDNLMDVTQMEAGVFNVLAMPSDLGPLLADVQSSFRKKGVDAISVSAPAEMPKVSMDRRRVQQVMETLLSNAIAWSQPGSPIEVSVQVGARDVTVNIHCASGDIPKEKLASLFQKAPPGSGTHQGESFGLGLAVCKGIIEAHGGRIWADSSMETGSTTFGFTLPIASVQAPEERPPVVTQRANHVGRVRRPGEKTRILAVDDEPQMLRYLQRTLSSAGYHPIVTNDPSAAADLVATEEPDLVLLDMVFPGDDGFQVLRQIREVSGVPVLFLSAVDGEAIVQALQAGADDYITKPFSASELLARVEAALRRRVLPDQMEVRPPYRLNGLTIDFKDRRVTLHDQPVQLSATEYKLLFALAENAGKVLTNEELLRRVWGPEYSGESHLLRSFVRNLRHKLQDDARSPRIIFTERGVGYRMQKV